MSNSTGDGTSSSSESSSSNSDSSAPLGGVRPGLVTGGRKRKRKHKHLPRKSGLTPAGHDEVQDLKERIRSEIEQLSVKHGVTPASIRHRLGFSVEVGREPHDHRKWTEWYAHTQPNPCPDNLQQRNKEMSTKWTALKANKVQYDRVIADVKEWHLKRAEHTDVPDSKELLHAFAKRAFKLCKAAGVNDGISAVCIAAVPNMAVDPAIIGLEPILVQFSASLHLASDLSHVRDNFQARVYRNPITSSMLPPQTIEDDPRFNQLPRGTVEERKGDRAKDIQLYMPLHFIFLIRLALARAGTQSLRWEQRSRKNTVMVYEDVFDILAEVSLFVDGWPTSLEHLLKDSDTSSGSATGTLSIYAGSLIHWNTWSMSSTRQLYACSLNSHSSPPPSSWPTPHLPPSTFSPTTKFVVRSAAGLHAAHGVAAPELFARGSKAHFAAKPAAAANHSDKKHLLDFGMMFQKTAAEHKGNKVLSLEQRQAILQPAITNLSPLPIFAKVKATVHALAAYISSNPSLTHISVEALVGHTGPQGLGWKSQESVLRNFRRGDTHLLIATSVVEEGLDVPACNFVIRFDLPETAIPTIHSRGRARERGSTIFMMCEGGSVRDAKLIEHCRGMEQDMKDWLQGLPEDRLVSDVGSDGQAEFVPNWTETIKSEETGAKIEHKDAMSLLNWNVQALPKDEYTPASTFISLEEDETGPNSVFRCTLQMPAKSKLREVRSEWQLSKKAARQEVAFNACKQLFKIGELDNRLLPRKPERIASEVIEVKDDEGEVRLLKRHNLPRPGAKLFATEQTAIETRTFRITTIPFDSIDTAAIQGSVAPLLLLTSAEAPDDELAVELNLPNGKVKLLCRPGHAGTLTLTEDQHRLAQVYTLRLLGMVGRLGSVPGPTHGSWMILPLDQQVKNGGEDEVVVQWEQVAILAAQSSPVFRSASHAESLGDDVSLCAIPDFSKPPSALYRIRDDPTPSSLGPRVTRQGRLGETFQQFYERVSGNRVDGGGPMLETRAMPRLQNFTTAGAMRALSKSLTFLIPAVSLVHPVPSSVYRAAILLPSVLDRLNAMCLAREFIRSLLTSYYMTPVSNRVLAGHSLRLTLWRYVCSDAFSTKTWAPPGYFVTDEEDGLSKAPSLPWSAKRLVDIVEAILGSATTYTIDQKLQVASQLGLLPEEISSFAAFGTAFQGKLDGYMPTADMLGLSEFTKRLMERIQFKFEHPLLAIHAVTRSSCMGFELPSYECLETLGHALLDFLVVEMLQKKYEFFEEGELTIVKANCVSNKTLAALAVNSNLDAQFLPNTGGASLADIVESLLGAVLVEARFNLDVARAYFDRLYRMDWCITGADATSKEENGDAAAAASGTVAMEEDEQVEENRLVRVMVHGSVCGDIKRGDKRTLEMVEEEMKMVDDWRSEKPEAPGEGELLDVLRELWPWPLRTKKILLGIFFVLRLPAGLPRRITSPISWLVAFFRIDSTPAEDIFSGKSDRQSASP
ncbi:unnamed protein product [Tilletia laevis]|uniref:Helicase C-terminal domain-containing protein n=2 Tax=Tilletia TaxID=13289 RepID=A0A9N8LL56_9BASI|nr:unnamed protein product [Tilletia laevis]